jgi:hypothetical protein
MKRQHGRQLGQIRHAHTRDGLTHLLQTFDDDTATAVDTLDGIVAAIERIQTVCSSAIQETAEMRITHRNALLVHKKLADIEKWEGAPDNLNAILLVSNYDDHDALDAAVDVLTKAEYFCDKVNCPLPTSQRAALSARIASSKENAAQWYLKQWTAACSSCTAATATAAAASSTTTQSLSRNLIELGHGEACRTTYLSIRIPHVRNRCSQRIGSTLPSLASLILSLDIIMSEEADFLSSVFGNVVEGGLGVDHEIPNKCFDEIVNQCAILQIQKSLKSVLERYDFDHSKVMQSLEELNKECQQHHRHSGLESTSTSASNSKSTSTSTSANDSKKGTGRKFPTRTSSGVSSPLVDGVFYIFRSLEEGGIIQLCSAAVAADRVKNTLQHKVDSGIIGAKSFELMRPLLEYGISQKIRQWCKHLFDMMAHPTFLAVSTHVYCTTSASKFGIICKDDGEGPGVNSVTQLALLFAVEYTRHQDIKVLLLEDISTRGLTANKYALLVLSSLGVALESSVVTHATISPIHTHYFAARTADSATTALEVSVRRCINVLNSMQYMKLQVSDVDDDGTHVKSLGASIERLVQHRFVPLFTSILTTQTKMPVLKEPSDLTKLKSIPSTSPFCRALKERFGAMNTHFDDWRTIWLSWILDPTLQKSIREHMIVALNKNFVPFYEKYSKVPFSKKNMQQYTRWSTDKITMKLLPSPQ